MAELKCTSYACLYIYMYVVPFGASQATGVITWTCFLAVSVRIVRLSMKNCTVKTDQCTRKHAMQEPMYGGVEQGDPNAWVRFSN